MRTFRHLSKKQKNPFFIILYLMHHASTLPNTHTPGNKSFLRPDSPLHHVLIAMQMGFRHIHQDNNNAINYVGIDNN